jgi:AcrR family transcriptional regulator
VTHATADPQRQCPHVPRRADARRNIGRVLEAAEELFATQGLAVPIDVVAAKAGVGVGTVYRHFPTKEALFHAVVVARLDALVARAKQLADAPDAGQALFGFVTELADVAAQKKDLTDELARAGIDSEQVHSTIKEELEEAFDFLLRRAQVAGAVREDVTSADVVALLMGACMAADRRGSVGSAHLLVGVICDGLRPRVS